MTSWPITTNYFRMPFQQRREFVAWDGRGRTRSAQSQKKYSKNFSTLSFIATAKEDRGPGAGGEEDDEDEEAER